MLDMNIPLSQSGKQAVIPFRCEPDLFVALKEIKERDGIPVNEQLRRAARAWVDDRRKERRRRG